jgi:Arc/MetJ-type ribon-helix-helix transcriptional regulator
MTIQVAVRLDDGVVEQLDALVESGTGPANRTEAVRAALDLYLTTQRRRRIDHALVAGYRRQPPGSPDAWGDLDGQSAAASALTLAELDAEDGGW